METSLAKPPLILDLNPLHSLSIPLCMTTDVMHLAGNISDLLISLWHADMDIGPGDDKSTWDWAIFKDKDLWTSHGKDVAAAGSFLPGSYDHKPHNIAEKINTQYKTWEFQMYMFGIAPILLYGILPMKYWFHYCQLVRGFQIICQYSLTHEQLKDVHTLLCMCLATELQAFLLPTLPRPHLLCLSRCPPGHSPSSRGLSKRTSHLLCTMDHGANDQQLRSTNLSTIQTICQPCSRGHLLLPSQYPALHHARAQLPPQSTPPWLH